MMRNIQYLLRWLFIGPLIPILYLQGRKLRSEITELPEAKHPTGLAEHKEAHTSVKILFLGESTIAGLGVEEHENGFAGYFARRWSQVNGVNVHWDVVARSGYTAKLVRRKSLKHIPEECYDYIVVGLGGNDAFQLTPIWRWEREIRGFIKDLKRAQPGAQIIFLQMPPIRLFPAFSKLMKWVFGGQVDLLGGAMTRIADGNEDIHFPEQRITEEAWSEYYPLDEGLDVLFSDGVHPSELTYRMWAKYTVDWMDGRKSLDK